MGESNRKEVAGTATHEPKVPRDGWPHSHVDVKLLDANAPESILVTIHGRQHYLHSSTAAALAFELTKQVKNWLDATNDRTKQVVLETLNGRFDKK